MLLPTISSNRIKDRKRGLLLHQPDRSDSAPLRSDGLVWSVESSPLRRLIRTVPFGSRVLIFLSKNPKELQSRGETVGKLRVSPPSGGLTWSSLLPSVGFGGVPLP